MRISDWSSDVCSSDLLDRLADRPAPPGRLLDRRDPAIGEPRVELDQDHFRGFGARAQLLLSPDKVGLRLIGQKVDRRQTPAPFGPIIPGLSRAGRAHSTKFRRRSDARNYRTPLEVRAARWVTITRPH